MGTPKGGKICWPAAGGGGTAYNRFIVEESRTARDMYPNNNYGLWYIQNKTAADSCIVGSTNKLTMWFAPQDNYDGSGFEWRIYGGVDNPSSSDTHTYSLQSGLYACGEDVGGAWVNSSPATTCATGTGGDPLIYTPWTAFTPENAWAAGKGLYVEIVRTDNNSDNPKIVLVKIKYRCYLEQVG